MKSTEITSLLKKRNPIKLSDRLPLSLMLESGLCAGIASSSPAQAAERQQELETLLKRLPDADKDGKLIIQEEKAYRAAHPPLGRKQQADRSISIMQTIIKRNHYEFERTC